jgi:hypothetical protein
MRLHIFDGIKGEVAIDATAVVAIVPAESPIGEHAAILLSGGHKVIVQGSVAEIYALLAQPPVVG